MSKKTKFILQAAEMNLGRLPSKDEVLEWWNEHRQQDPRNIVGMHFNGTRLIVYYSCEIDDYD